MSLMIAVSGLCPALLAEDGNMHTSSFHSDMLLETSNFTDHGFGEKNVTPEMSGKLLSSGEMEMSRQMGQAPNWIPGQFSQRSYKPSTFLSPSCLRVCRFGGWQTLTTGTFLTSVPLLTLLPMPVPPPSLALENTHILQLEC